jgi:hypothetical protein
MSGAGHNLHNMHNNQQSSRRTPHRPLRKQIMLGLQVTHCRVCTPTLHIQRLCAPLHDIQVNSAMQSESENPKAGIAVVNNLVHYMQTPMWESVNGSFLKVRTQQMGGTCSWHGMHDIWDPT